MVVEFCKLGPKPITRIEQLYASGKPPRLSIFAGDKFKELEIKMAMLFLWIIKRIMGCVPQVILTDFNGHIFIFCLS